ncbi:MAG: PorT family protein [Prevotellaceae bacterium]|nr:PorT family protein [Prevotellaceae bacterium]
MKKTVLLFALFCSVAASAQDKWSIIGGVGAGVYKITERDFSVMEYTFEGKTYDPKLTIVADVGIRYNVGMFHLQSGINYAFTKPTFDMSGLVTESPGLEAVDINNKQFIGVPLLVGFNYRRQYMIYPLVQAGIIGYYALNQSVDLNGASAPDEKDFVLTIAGNAGVGINLFDKTSIELTLFYHRAEKAVFIAARDNYMQSIGGKLSVVFRL